jgi:prepilin-type N-terminal cleavage/methylation domain-containing protein
MMRTPAKIIRDWRKGKKGFTLIEVIIATVLFSTVSLIGVMVFTDVARIQRRIYLESALYEDGRFLMERIAREIRQNTIDYDEYHNRYVDGGAFGQYFGCYATRFYNPGKNTDGSPDAIGAKCSAPKAVAGQDPLTHPGCVINKNTLDINTGRNPYMGISIPYNNASDANAFCDKKYNSPANCDPQDFTLYRRDQLYLIDPKGKQKTIFALKKVNAAPVENALSMLKLDGVDTNKDGLTETWWDPSATPTNYYCDPAFDCAPENFAPSNRLEETLDASGENAGKLWQGFVPISPLRSNIKSLYFFVSPLEDPRKAFAETDPALGVLQQPHVTIIMTLTPAASQLSGYSGGVPPSVTLQMSVSSRVYNEVKSYTGKAVCQQYL